jgi:micrococcal nuclease
MGRCRHSLVVPRVLRCRRCVLPFVTVAVAASVLWWQHHRAPPSPPENLAEGSYPLERVIDGDTLLLANGARIRLIGANAPETVQPDHAIEPWGPEAGQFTAEFVSGGLIRLQFDRERLDQDGRFLAYVRVGNRMLNEELIRAGLARAELGFRFSESMKTRFRRAEQEAKDAGRGIWSQVPAGPAP